MLVKPFSAITVFAVCSLFCFCPIAYAQDLPTKPSTPTFVINVSPEKENPTRKATEQFTEVAKGHEKNFDEHQELLKQLPANDPKYQETLKRLEKIAKEMERLNKEMEKFVDAINQGKPAPSVATNADPEAYRDKNGNQDEELLKKLLEAGVAGVCVYQPQYCMVATMIAKLLGLNLDNIKETTQALGSLNDAIQAGKADPKAAKYIAGRIKAPSQTVEGIMKRDNSQRESNTETLKKSFKSLLEEKIEGIAKKYGVDEDKLNQLVYAFGEAEDVEELIKKNSFLREPSDNEKEATLEVLSALRSSGAPKPALSDQLKQYLKN